MHTKRIASLAAALVLGASTAHAQALATFGSAELAGYGEGSVLLGTSLSTGRLGWGPVGTLIGQTYRYRSGPSSHNQAWAISPSLGLQYSMPEGSVQGSVGYSFVSDDSPLSTFAVAGSQFGGKNSAFVSAQANYWGNGEHGAQWIGNYAFETEYYWTRARVNQRFVTGPHPIYLGLEGVLQGSQKTQTVITTGGTSFVIPTQTRYQVGPTIEYRITNDFRVGASAGYRGGNNNYPGTGYGRVEFLALSRW
jgi:hypothetical protein